MSEEETLPLFIRKRKRVKDRIQQIPISPDKVRPRKKQRPHRGIITQMGKAGRMQQTEKKREISRMNKQRSQIMERRIAKVFGGVRVPLSGAAKHWKGDVLVPIINEKEQVGHFIIECKLSSKLSKSIPTITFLFDWFNQLEVEIYTTRAKFGFIVFYFHGSSHYYAAITPANLSMLLTYQTNHAMIQHILHSPTNDNWSQRSESTRANGKHQRQFHLTTEYLQNNMQHIIVGDNKLSWMNVSMYNHAQKRQFNAIIMPLAMCKDILLPII